MKKLLLLLCAFVASVSGAWGQEPDNLAKGATVTWGTDANHTEVINGTGVLSNLTDGDDGTNVQVKFEGDNTVLSVVLDLGGSKQFNTLLINQTGDRHNTAFQLYVSTDKSVWTEVTTNSTGVTSGKFVATFTQQEAQYVKYVSSKSDKNVQDEWGAGLAEIQLYKLGTIPVLASITLTASSTTASVGDNITLTPLGNADQFGAHIGLGDITWNNDNTTAGTISAGVYTAAAAGTSVVSATVGGITSNTVSISVVAGSKIDLLTNWQYRIYPLGTDTKAAGRDGLVDANDGSLWELHGGTGDDEPSRTYDTGFIADLGAIFDINSISIKFEGACSADYTISVAGDDGVFGDAKYTVSNHAGMATYTEIHTGADISGARYVKFLSTKAATQYGVKIYDFSVVGTKTGEAATNASTPTISSATFVSPTGNSLTLNITTTDDAPYVLYQITGVGTDRWITGKTGVAESFVLGGLEEGTDYTASIIAYDAAAHGSAISSPSGTTTGGVADETAPTMTKAAVTTVGATTVRLTVSATDNVAGTITYNVKKGEDVVGTGSGAAGEDVIIDVAGLTAETTYPAGTFKVIATDASSNTSSAMDVAAFTTTVKPTEDAQSTTIRNSSDESLNGKVINYTCTFTQTGSTVTVTFNYTTPESISGLVQYDVTATGGINIPTASYQWTDCTVGQILHAHSSWACANGGMAETVEYYYVVASIDGDGGGLMKLPADANKITSILGKGTINATAFKNLTTTDEVAYDLTGLKVTSPVALEANNPNAVFIVKDDAQKANLAGTKNMVIWNAGGSRYEGDIEIVDQNNANTFATNLPIYATSVSYTRNVAADKYVTIALPFTPTTTTTGFSAYAVDGDVSAGKINFQKTTTGMIAGTAYMLHNTGDAATDFVASASGVVLDFTEGTSGLFRSVFNAKSLTDGDNAYILSGGKFKHALTGASIGGFRGYIYYAVSPSRELEITIDGNVTGINDVKGKTEEGHGVMYNLQGQEVKNPAKGIYIMNGKKFIKR